MREGWGSTACVHACDFRFAFAISRSRGGMGKFRLTLYKRTGVGDADAREWKTRDGAHDEDAFMMT